MTAAARGIRPHPSPWERQAGPGRGSSSGSRARPAPTSPPIPRMENQRLRRPHLHSPQWLVPAAAVHPGLLEGWGSEPSAGAPYFPLPPAPPLSPLSPCLLLLQLPRVVNSLKLLIKNILLSPPQGLLPCDFPLRRRHGRKGGGGRAVAKEWGSAFLGLHGGCRGTGAWLPPAPCHSPWLPGSVGRHFRRLQPWVSWRQEWRQLPRALRSLLPPRPTGPLAQVVAQAHFHWRQGALPSRESAARSSSLGVTLSPLVSDGEVSLGSTSSGKMQSRLVS